MHSYMNLCPGIHDIFICMKIKGVESKTKTFMNEDYEVLYIYMNFDKSTYLFVFFMHCGYFQKQALLPYKTHITRRIRALSSIWVDADVQHYCYSYQSWRKCHWNVYIIYKFKMLQIMAWHKQTEAIIISDIVYSGYGAMGRVSGNK